MHSLDASVLVLHASPFPIVTPAPPARVRLLPEAGCGLSWAVTCLSVRRRVGWELHIRLNGMVGVRLGIQIATHPRVIRNDLSSH
jgi:hypothetical protein